MTRPLPVTLGVEASAIVRRVAPRGQGKAFVDRAVIETAARDEARIERNLAGEVDELRSRVAELERRVGP